MSGLAIVLFVLFTILIPAVISGFHAVTARRARV
jgi:hypothetical protein